MQAIETGRHESGMKGWVKGIYLLGGLFFMGMAIFIVGLVFRQPKTGPMVILGIPGFAIGAYLMTTALRSRLVIDGTRIEVYGAIRQNSADLSEIEGFRILSTRNGKFWKIYLKQGRGSFLIPQWVDCAEFQAWLKQVTDLDEQARKQVLTEIEQNQDLGATPEDRLARLAGAKKVNIGAAVVAIAAALGFGFGAGAVRSTSALVLALIPAGLIYLVHSAPLLYGLFTPKRDPRANLGLAFLVCGIGLIFGNHGVHFVETPRMLEYAALTALLCCAGIYSAVRKNPQFWSLVLGVLFLAGPYAWGVAAAADTVPDKSVGTGYAAQVVSKHVTSGRSTSYYLDLSPWGPEQGKNDVSVSSSIYHKTSIGEQVCLQLHPGLLHVQWYTLVACEGGGQ
jgi:hypothetical protein